ncbi:phage portal protein [Vibrio harveyi]|uniref:phage portal protein n=1 Tax=Vibrio harveyi TaxID=669 RepID=UPI000346493C|nr:phage portal protein [Vibrio harveyi]GEA22322.1 phage portal protein [Vibrio harveyi]HDM8166676.1 phage portal protein [Vibrio harveyi]
MAFNIIDKVRLTFKPENAAKIISSREMIAQYKSATGKRAGKRSREEIRVLEEVAQLPLAQQGRYYEENFPIVKSTLDEIVKNVVGQGINVNPTPMLTNGEPATELAIVLKRMYAEFNSKWCMDGRTTRSDAEALQLRSYCRDGEVFNRIYNFEDHDFLTPIKLGFQPFETDHVPTDLTDEAANVHRGFKLGAYNRVEGIYYNADPNAFTQSPVFIPNGDYLHFANKNRLNSLRGFSDFSAAMGAIANLANFEEATQIALKAASKITMVHYVSNNSGNVADFGGQAAPVSNLNFAYSNVAQVAKDDKVEVHESAKGIGDTVRAIRELERQIVTSAKASVSSTTGRYEGNYSAQRQELVDAWASYIILRAKFVDYIVRPSYERFVYTLYMQGLIKLPRGLDISTIANAEFTGAVMPWIDPKKEAESLEILMDIGMLPLSLALAQRGYDITNILNRYHQDRKLGKKLGLEDLLMLERKVTNAKSKGANDAKSE